MTTRRTHRALPLGVLATLTIAGGLLGACSTAKNAASQPDSGLESAAGAPTIVLVHGAWAGTSSWDGEAAALRK